MNEVPPDHDINDVSERDAHTYATTKLAAAAVLSASYLPDMVAAYNLGFVGAAYTTAHEAVELLLKLYLQRGPQRLAARETWGHDLAELFGKWSDDGRRDAELAYQTRVFEDITFNRVCAVVNTRVTGGRHGVLPPNLQDPAKEYEKAHRETVATLLREESPTVGVVVQRIDAILGAKNITDLCRNQARRIQGFECGPRVWYPEELLALPWERLEHATERGEPLGLIEAFLIREGTKGVFLGWRYLAEQTLERIGHIFHGPPAKMIDIGQSLESVVWKGVEGEHVP